MVLGLSGDQAVKDPGITPVPNAVSALPLGLLHYPLSGAGPVGAGRALTGSVSSEPEGDCLTTSVLTSERKESRCCLWYLPPRLVVLGVCVGVMCVVLTAHEQLPFDESVGAKPGADDFCAA
eukprot:2173546-Rhodomonas_salina.1